jgi:hypothetical protein
MKETRRRSIFDGQSQCFGTIRKSRFEERKEEEENRMKPTKAMGYNHDQIKTRRQGFGVSKN